MDRKTIIVLVVSFLMLLMWPVLTNRIWPPVPAPNRTNQVAGLTNILNRPTNGVSATPTSAGAPPAVLESVPLAAAGTTEELLVLEDKNGRYTFTSRGGGLKLVELKAYPAVVKCGQNRASVTNRVTLNTAAPSPSMAVLGGEAIQGDGQFKLVRLDNGVRAEKVLSNGLRWVKEYQLSTNYQIAVKTRLENQSGKKLDVPGQEWIVGTATALGAMDDPTRLGVYWYNGAGKESVNEAWFANRTLGCIPGTPRAEYRQGAGNVVWGAVHGQFFTLAVIPQEPAPEIRVVPLELSSEAIGTAQIAGKAVTPAQRRAFQASYLYPAATLEPQQAIERNFMIYAGPKEYKILARLGAAMKNNLDVIMDYEGFFGWFAQVLLSSMNGLNAMGLGYALAIIAITIIIKLLFWPLTNASTKSMKRMAALQPQMKALQEKYKEDPAKMNRKLMEFMKEHKVSPLGGCLPMLLQIPVFFGFFKMIQNAIELRGAQFLWACDLSQPDTIFILPGLNFPVNPLPLLMGVTMLWQARLTPPSPGMDPMQQKMMRYMPVMFLFILYNFSAGLTLYWTVQNLLTIAQMKLTKTKDESTGAPGRGPVSTLAPKKRK